MAEGFWFWFAAAVFGTAAGVLILLYLAWRLLRRGPGATAGQQPDYRDRGDDLIQRHPHHT